MEEQEQQIQPKNSVARSTAIMSACTLASRATGFIRTWAMAFAIGNTVMAAGFSLANNLPNMIYELVAGGVLSTAFLPIYLQQLNQKNRQSASGYASNLLSICVVVLGVIALLASIFAPQVMLTQTLFNNASEQAVTDAIWFFRFLSFEIIFYGISAIFSGLLNAHREFFWPAVSSIFMNIIAIIGFFGYPVIASTKYSGMGTTWLGATMLLSIAVMAFVQVPALRKADIKLRFHIDLKGEGLGETLRLALPAIACTAINLVALSFMNSCALYQSPTGPASVSYAWMWYQFPYGVLGVALSTAMFTEMSECTARKDWDGFKGNLLRGLKSTWILIIPMAALVFACANQLIGLYAAGEFTSGNIAPIAFLLQGWAVALPLYAGYMFVYRAYSAMKDMKTVAICNFFLTIIQVTLYMLNTGVIGPIKNGMGLIGLAFADIVFYSLMLIVLLAILKKRMGDLDLPSLVPSTLKISIASLIGGACAFAVQNLMTNWIGVSNVANSFAGLVAAGIVGLVVIGIMCKLLRIQEMTAVVSGLKRKLKR